MPILVLDNFEFLSISIPHILIDPEVFNTGEVVEGRRNFIQEHSLEVINLDI